MAQDDAAEVVGEKEPIDPEEQVGIDDDEDGFADDASAEGEDSAADIDDLDEVDDDADEGDIDAVVELSSKEQSARSLELRRAIEERMEARQLNEDLDYLDFPEDDFD